MVHKTSHRGVHSGNTLRAFNSRYSRRYHHQSFIVSRIHPELLKTLTKGEKTDEKKPDQQNNSVNVALSLNKQSRWLLPSALVRQIESNNIANTDVTVSLLQRHKLKQASSCVSFHSNRGDVKRIQPRNGRYFGFNYSTVLEGKSRRALRRERREELAGLKKKNTINKGKTVVVFTEQGAVIKDGIGESEVRYEVYYPSPACSSISHNPKYIKQDVDGIPGDSSDRVQHGKPKKQHRGKQRKRMTLKDVDDCDLPSCFSQLTVTVPDTTDHEDFPPLDDVREEESTTELLLSSLIEKAQHLENFRGLNKSRRRKKNEKSSADYEDDKSHIVYIDQESTNVSTESYSLASPPPPSIPLDSTRVLLPKEDVTMDSLKECFGLCYFEAQAKPRRFVLDITNNVREVFKKQGVLAKIAENVDCALSYLICIHDGFYDEEYDVYRVLLNSKLNHGLLAVQVSTEEHQDLYRGTVMSLLSQTLDFVDSLVTKVAEKEDFPRFHEIKTSSDRHLKKHIASSEAYVPSVQRVFQMGSADFDLVMPEVSDLLQDDPVFCEVCYDDISPLTLDSATFTSLLKCQHLVCDTCWSQHIHTRLHAGFVRLTCPGHDCQEEVKVGVLLSVADLDTVDKLLQRQEEVRIGGSNTEKWCPNEWCGRVIHLQPASSPDKLELQQDVVCACGTHVCFNCLMPAHWPASCTQAQDYRLNLGSMVFPNRQDEVHVDYQFEKQLEIIRKQQETSMVVEGKHCPRCKNFVYKFGGCPQMTCRCGQLFCWFCAKPGFSHPDHRCVDATREKKLTTTLVVRHLDNKSQPTETKPPPASKRQRVSLLEKASEHRQSHRLKAQNGAAIATLAKAVTTAAAKNKILAQHIVNACSGAFSSLSTNSNSDPSTVLTQPAGSVLETVTSFLKSVAHSKQELHEVVEYSLVLLKDLPDSLHRRQALRVSDDLGAFCSFSQSVFDAWSRKKNDSSQGQLQEAVKAVMRLVEIQGWVHSALHAHVVTIRKLRQTNANKQ